MEKVNVMFTAEQVAARVAKIAAEINKDYAGHQVTFICALKGAVIFMADLVRLVNLDSRMEFIRVSSYGNKAESSGDIRLDAPLEVDLKGKHVILVDDIVDRGYTAKWLQDYMKEFSPATVRLCALLDKPERRQAKGVEIEYLGFTIPDKFVVGYGLDYSQRYRQLPYIGWVEVDDEVNR